MRVKLWWWVLVLGIGVVLGAGGILASLFANRYTATDAFCASCHSMASLAADSHFQHSAHRSNSEGVIAGCGDCHIPNSNWFVETYTHVSSGVRDAVAELTHDYNDPQKWEARRVELAHEVRRVMRAQDSITCRGCHDPAAVAPASEAGRAAHALMRQGRGTCIDCHFNLVHGSVPPSMEFLRSSGIGGPAK